MMEKGKKKRQIQMSKIRTKKGNKRTYKVGVFHVDKGSVIERKEKPN